MGDHENRDVALYDNFAGDNSSLKFIMNLEKKKKMLTSFYATFWCGLYNISKKMKNKLFAPQNIKKLPPKVAHNWLG